MLKNSLEESSILEFAEKYKSKLTPLRPNRVFPPLGPLLIPTLPIRTPPLAAFVDLYRAGYSDFTCPVRWGTTQSPAWCSLFGHCHPTSLSILSSNFSKARLLYFLMTQGPLPHTPARSFSDAPLASMSLYLSSLNLSTPKAQLGKLLWSSQWEMTLSCFAGNY